MEVFFDHDQDENLTHAYEELKELLDKYNVDLCANVATEFWLETKEKPKPELKIV